MKVFIILILSFFCFGCCSFQNCGYSAPKGGWIAEYTKTALDPRNITPFHIIPIAVTAAQGK